MVGFAAWCLWLVVQIGVVLTDLPERNAPALVWVAYFSCIPMIAGGCVLTWVLAKQPRKGFSVVLAILSAILLWKFYAGEIMLGMHPQLGGYTFRQSVAVWLSRNTASIGHFVLWFPPMLLLAASVAFYPIYTIVHQRADA